MSRKAADTTNIQLPDWPRPRFEKPGGRPSLFFVIYGEFSTIPALPGSEYRSAGVPDGFDLFRYDAGQHPDVLPRFREGYLWDEFQHHNSQLASQIAKATECLILKGEIDDCETLNYLRDSIGVLTHLLDNGGIGVFDPHMFQWWAPEVWRDSIFNVASPDPCRHVVVLTSEEAIPTRTWVHTRGMRKFGRPDLSIHDVSLQHNQPIIDLCERFIDYQAFGGVIDDGQAIRMNSLPDGMACHHRGHLNDPDFNNVHVEIVWG